MLHGKQHLEAETVLLTPQHSGQYSGDRRLASGEQLRLGIMDREPGQSGELIPAAPELPPPIAEDRKEGIEGGYAEGSKQCGTMSMRLEGRSSKP